ncbi:MAG: TolC family protein, partial [Alphaproteobacteria bacterium]|nr:TolC family protein [Alphaproteobacteria bacterium]
MTLYRLNFRRIQPIFLSGMLMLSSLASVSAEEKNFSPSAISPPKIVSVSFSEKGSFLLDQFLQEVMQANPNLQSAQFQAEAMQYKIKPAGSLEDPVIGIGPDDIPLNGAEGNVIRYQINQVIPFPGKPITRSKIAKAKAEASSSDVETTRRQLILFATQVYYKTYLNQEAIRLNDETQRLIKALIDTSKSRYETGGGSHHEWLLGKAEL